MNPENSLKRTNTCSEMNVGMNVATVLNLSVRTMRLIVQDSSGTRIAGKVARSINYNAVFTNEQK